MPVCVGGLVWAVEEGAVSGRVVDYLARPVEEADEQKLRLTWGVRSLPWLIFTDRDHVVAAEGPQMAVLNLEAKER